MDAEEFEEGLLDISCLLSDYPFVINGSQHEGLTIDTDDITYAQQGKIRWRNGVATIDPLAGPLTTSKILNGLEPYLDLINLERSNVELRFYRQGTYSRLYTLRNITDSDGKAEACDSKEYILKINLPVWAYFKTASEAATLQYIQRLCPYVPVPKIQAFDADLGSNDLGFEWLIMDKLPGISFAEAEPNLTTGQKIRIARTLAEWQMKLTYNCRFGHTGSLYMTHSVPEGVSQQSYPNPVNPSTMISYIDNEIKLYTVNLVVPRLMQPPKSMPVGDLYPEPRPDSCLQHMNLDAHHLFVDPDTGEPTGLCGWSRTSTQLAKAVPYYPAILMPETYGWELEEMPKPEPDEADGYTEAERKEQAKEWARTAKIKKTELLDWPTSISKTPERIRQEKEEENKKTMDLMRYAFRSTRDRARYRSTRVAKKEPYKPTGLSQLYSTENIHEYAGEDQDSDDEQDPGVLLIDPQILTTIEEEDEQSLIGNADTDSEGQWDDTDDDDDGEQEDEDEKKKDDDAHDEDEEDGDEADTEEKWSHSVKPDWEDDEETAAAYENLPSVLASLLEESEKAGSSSSQSSTIPVRGNSNRRNRSQFAIRHYAGSDFTWYGEEEIL